MDGMEQGKALFDKCKGVWKNLWLEKRGVLLLCLGIAGMVLVFLSSLPKSRQETKPSSSNGTGAVEYATQMEQRLAIILSHVDGVGECQVMVTTESGVEHVYAVEESRNTNESNSYDGEGLQRQTQQVNSAQKYIVMEAGAGKKEALLKTERLPKIQGVVVVCEGAGSMTVQQRVTEVVATALDIPYTKVCVTKIGK